MSRAFCCFGSLQDNEDGTPQTLEKLAKVFAELFLALDFTFTDLVAAIALVGITHKSKSKLTAVTGDGAVAAAATAVSKSYSAADIKADGVSVNGRSSSGDHESAKALLQPDYMSAPGNSTWSDRDLLFGDPFLVKRKPQNPMQNPAIALYRQGSGAASSSQSVQSMVDSPLLVKGSSSSLAGAIPSPSPSSLPSPLPAAVAVPLQQRGFAAVGINGHRSGVHRPLESDVGVIGVKYDEPGGESQDDAVSLGVLEEALHWHRFANAVYGWPMYLWSYRYR